MPAILECCTTEYHYIPSFDYHYIRMPSLCDWISTAVCSCVGMKHLSRTAAWIRCVSRRLSSCLHVWMKLPKPRSLYRPRFMPRSSPSNPRLVSVCFHVTEYEVLHYILVDFTTVVIPFLKNKNIYSSWSTRKYPGSWVFLLLKHSHLH